MIKIVKEYHSLDDSIWLRCCIEQVKTAYNLGRFCGECGFQYRHIYQVLNGRRSLEYSYLEAMKKRAAELGLANAIDVEVSKVKLGILGSG